MKKIAFLTVLLLTVLSVLPLTVQASVNKYQSRTYTTREEIEELRSILDSDTDYVALRPDVKGYEILQKDREFWNGGVLDEYNAEFYTVYVLKSDLEKFLNAKTEEDKAKEMYILNTNCVVVSTYALDMEDDSKTFYGPRGGDIPEGWSKCLLTVRAEIDTDTFNRDIMVGFTDIDGGFHYEFLLQKGNGFSITDSVPAGTYEVSYIMTNSEEKFQYTYDIGEDNVLVWLKDTNPVFTLKVATKKENMVSVTQSPTNKTDTPIQYDNNGGLIDSSDNNNIVPQPYEKKDNSTLILIIEIAVIVLIVVVVVIVLVRLKKKGNNNDSF